MDNGTGTWEGPFHPTPVSQASQQRWDPEESDNETTSSKLSYGQNSAAEVGDGQYLPCSLPAPAPPPPPPTFSGGWFSSGDMGQKPQELRCVHQWLAAASLSLAMRLQISYSFPRVL